MGPLTAAAVEGPVDWRELSKAQKRELRERLRERRRALVLERWPRPADIALQLDDTTLNPPHLQLLDEHLADVAHGRCERLMVIMPPQEGKSERTSHYGVLWMLLLNPELRIAIVSFEAETARRWGQKIRDDLASFDLPLQLQEDSRAAGRWNIKGHKGGVYCVGIGGALTGRPVDVLVIDDPVKDRKTADSEVVRDAAWNWWTDVARTRLAPGGAVVLIQTRWHEDDLAGRIKLRPGSDAWRVLRIAAQAEPPLPGEEPDPLGRAYGEYLPSARKWPAGRWEAVRLDVGTRTWNALYQGRPAAVEGDVLKRQWWRRYDRALWVDRDDGTRWMPDGGVLVQSWDMAFKDLKTSDFVVGQVWAKYGAMSYLVDQVRGRWDFVETCEQVQLLAARWPQATAKLVEDKANGTAVMAQLRARVPGLIPVNPKESKEARAVACQPILEAGNVWLPADELHSEGSVLVDEAAAFPNGSHDDCVDTFSQAMSRLYELEVNRARLIA